MSSETDDAGRWLPLDEAAAELGLSSAEALRGQIRRKPGRYLVQRANDNRLLVLVGPDTPRPAARAAPSAQPVTDAGWLVVELLAALAASDARVVEIARRAEALERHVSDLQRALERRRWPGLGPLLRRLWEGD